MALFGGQPFFKSKFYVDTEQAHGKTQELVGYRIIIPQLCTKLYNAVSRLALVGCFQHI